MKTSELKNLKRNWGKDREAKEQVNGEHSGSWSSLNCFEFDDVIPPKGLDFLCEEKCLGRRLTMGKDREGCQITKQKKMKIYKDKVDGLTSIPSDHLQRYRTEHKISVHRPLKVHHETDETVIDKESSSEIIERSSKVTKNERPQYRTEKTIYIHSPAVDHREVHKIKDVHLHKEFEKSSEISEDERPQFREIKIHQPKIYHRRDIIESVSPRDKDTTEDKKKDDYIEEKERVVHVKKPETRDQRIRKISSKIRQLVEELDPNRRRGVQIKPKESKESVMEEVYRSTKAPIDERKRFRNEHNIYLQPPVIGRPQVEQDEDLRDGRTDVYVKTSVPDRSFVDKAIPTIQRDVQVEEPEAGQKDYYSLEEVKLNPKTYIDEKPRHRDKEYIYVQRPTNQHQKDYEVSTMGKTAKQMAHLKDNGFYEEKEEPTTDRIRRYLSTKIMHLAERIQPTDDEKDQQVRRESVEKQPVLYEEVEMAPKQSTGERPRFRTEDKIYLQYPTIGHQTDATQQTQDNGKLYGTIVERSQTGTESQSPSVEKFGESIDHSGKFDWKVKLHPIKTEDKSKVSTFQEQRHDWNVKLRPVEKIEKGALHPKMLELDAKLRPVEHKIKVEEQVKPRDVELRPVELTSKDESTKVYLKGKLSQVKKSDKDSSSSDSSSAYANYARKPMLIEPTESKVEDDGIRESEYVIYAKRPPPPPPPLPPAHPVESTNDDKNLSAQRYVVYARQPLSEESETDEPLYAEVSQQEYGPSVKATGKEIFIPKTYVDKLNTRQTFGGTIPKTSMTVTARPILVKKDEEQPKFEITLDDQRESPKEKAKKRVRIRLPDNGESQRQDQPTTKPRDVKLRPVEIELSEKDAAKVLHDWKATLQPVKLKAVDQSPASDETKHWNVKLGHAEKIEKPIVPVAKPWDVKLRPVEIKPREADEKKYTHDWNVQLKPVKIPVVKAEEKSDISPHFGIKLRPVGIVKTDDNADDQEENVKPPKTVYLVHDHNREVIYEPTNQVDVIQPQPARHSLLSRAVRRLTNAMAFWRPNENDDTDPRPADWRDTSEILPTYHPSAPPRPPPVQFRRGRGISPASHFGPEVYLRERVQQN